MVDSLDSGSSVHSGRAGSSPASRTMKKASFVYQDKRGFFLLSGQKTSKYKQYRASERSIGCFGACFLHSTAKAVSNCWYPFCGSLQMQRTPKKDGGYGLEPQKPMRLIKASTRHAFCVIKSLLYHTNRVKTIEKSGKMIIIYKKINLHLESKKEVIDGGTNSFFRDVESISWRCSS